MIAFLGMGLLGSNFTRALTGRGIEVQVWNRTASRARALEQFGAKAFADVSEAVKGAEAVHLTLKDDATVDEVLAAAAPGLSPGVVIIDHTTTSVEGAIERTAKWKERGISYLHAPVFMGPQNALDGSGYMLLSGDQDVICRVEPSLSPMTGKILNFGEETGRAAGMKLLGNCFLVSFSAGIADTLMLAKGMKIPVSDLTTLFDSWNPGAALPARLKRLSSGVYDQPSWELDMARKDVGLFLDAARRGDVVLTVIPAAAGLMDKWIAAGHGKQDWAVIAKDAIQQVQ